MSTIRLITPEEIRRLRKTAGLTQKELSKKAGVSQSLIARIENKTVDPRLSTIKKIVEAMVSSKEKTAKDVMHSPVIAVNHTDTIRKTIELMERHNISQMPVLKDEKIIGSIQESTLIDKIVRSGNPEKLYITQIYNLMEKRYPIVSLTTHIMDVLNLLSQNEPAVLVINKNILIGIITKIDLLSSIVRL